MLSMFQVKQVKSNFLLFIFHFNPNWIVWTVLNLLDDLIKPNPLDDLQLLGWFSWSMSHFVNLWSWSSFSTPFNQASRHLILSSITPSHLRGRSSYMIFKLINFLHFSKYIIDIIKGISDAWSTLLASWMFIGKLSIQYDGLEINIF